MSKLRGGKRAHATRRDGRQGTAADARSSQVGSAVVAKTTMRIKSNYSAAGMFPEESLLRTELSWISSLKSRARDYSAG